MSYSIDQLLKFLAPLSLDNIDGVVARNSLSPFSRFEPMVAHVDNLDRCNGAKRRNSVNMGFYRTRKLYTSLRIEI
jgi:hypothetical protein